MTISYIFLLIASLMGGLYDGDITVFITLCICGVIGIITGTIEKRRGRLRNE